jgi:hypothetical protein
MKKSLTPFFFYFILMAGYCQSGTYCNLVSDSLFAADPYVLFQDGRYYEMVGAVGEHWINQAEGAY